MTIHDSRHSWQTNVGKTSSSPDFGQRLDEGGNHEGFDSLEGLLFTEEGGIFGSGNEHIHLIWCLLDGQRSKGRGYWHCCASRGEKMSSPFFRDVGNIPLLFTTFCICLDCYWLLKSLSLSSLNVFPQIKFMEGMSLKETSDKDEKPCMVVYRHGTAPSTKGKLAEGWEVWCNPELHETLSISTITTIKIMKNLTSQRREGWQSRKHGLIWSLYDLGTWLPQKNVTV